MPSCPFCAEEIKDNLAKCPACGEALVEGKGVPKKKSGVPILAIVAILGVGMCCIVSIIAAIAIPNLIEARKHGNEASAIGALKTINTSQTLFREGDKEGDMTLDYAGSLAELSAATLIDGVLGTGVKQGYVFQVAASPTTPEFLWMAVASPMTPGTTGDRYFVTNHSGVIFYSNTAPFPITPDCAIPSNAVPVGR
jgi:type IV pilus assembly protein PilA